MKNNFAAGKSIDYRAMIEALNEVHYAGETSFYGTQGLRPIEEALYNNCPPAQRIIDIGCGAGRVTKAITELGGDIIGIDINQAALKAGNNFCPKGKFIHGSMSELPFSADSFDQVWCLRFSFNALAVAEDRRAALLEFWRVCAPGGTILIEVFNWHYLGRFGLIRAANIMDQISRFLRWQGQGRMGSQPLPPRDIIYLANKAAAAAPGYAHLTTAAEMLGLVREVGLSDYARLSKARDMVAGNFRSGRIPHRDYSMWLVMSKPG